MSRRRKKGRGVTKHRAGAREGSSKFPPGPKAARPETADRQAAPGAVPAGDSSFKQKAFWAGMLLLIYATAATWGHFDFSNMMGYYDLLADAFRKGQLYIDIRPGEMYVHDMIPYQGRYYLQWGPFPAVVHLAAKLIGLPLTDRVACLLIGWLTSLVFLQVLLTLRRRFFSNLPPAICFWFFFAFALATPAALLSLRGTVYHESIAMAGLGVMAAFGALLRYLEKRSWLWALAAGGAIAIAIASRVSVAVYGVGIGGALLAVQYLRKHAFSTALLHLAAYSAPILVSGTLLMAYNQARFGSPWDYGDAYLADAVPGVKPFDMSRVPENFRHYLLAPPKFQGDFPWIRHNGWGPVEKVARAEDVSSLILTSPFLLLMALCWLLLRWKRSAESDLPIFAVAAALSSALAFVAVLCFVAAARRYSHDFVPVWMILAFIGVGLHSRQIADRWRRWRGPAWALLVVCILLHLQLSFTQSFEWDPPDLNVMKTFLAVSPTARRFLPAGPNWNQKEAIMRNDMGTYLLNQGHARAALEHLEWANKLMPNEPRIQNNLALAKRRVNERRPRGNP